MSEAEVSKTSKYINIEEAYEMWLSHVDMVQGEALSKAMFKKLYPFIKGKRINHATATWALGKVVAAIISASQPTSPELSMMIAVGIHRMTVALLREHRVGGERQTGHA